MRKAFILGRVILTTTVNGLGAPFADKCTGTTEENIVWNGYAIQLNPFRFNKYGDRKIGLCFCIGLIKSLTIK